VTAISLSVPSSLDGVRVDRAVALLADVSRAAVDALVAAGRVTIDGTVVTSRSTRLAEGQVLAVDRPDEEDAPGPLGDPSVAFGVAYVDDDVVVVDKPAGLVVHPGAGHHSGTLVHGLVARFPDLADLPARVGSEPDRPGIVHRLDRGTSGLLVVARTPDAYRSLVAQLSSREVVRTYRALVLGTVEGESGVVDAPIGRSVSTPTRMAVSRKGKEARTRYRVEERFALPAPTTLVRASLETGRTHQIRVHLSAIGHPVVGDEPYGQGRSLPGASVRRPFLHASALAFDHPRSGERMSWTSELPEDLTTQLAALGH
jgi:23S rRNA pseudouridine1911/1915/1917 synthase